MWYYPLFFLILNACTQHSSWSLSQINNSEPQFHSLRYIYYSQDRYHGIDLELIEQPHEITAHFQVHGPAIKKPFILLTIENSPELFEGHCHAGGQRLFIPPELSNKIIEALRAKKEVTIQLDGYQETFTRLPLFNPTKSSFLNYFRL